MQTIERRIATLEELSCETSLRLVVAEDVETEQQTLQRFGYQAGPRVVVIASIDEMLKLTINSGYFCSVLKLRWLL